MYVDLNQLKAGAAQSLETSDYSAIQDRLRAWRSREAKASVEKFHQREGEEFRLEQADVEQLLADCWLAPIEERSMAGSAGVTTLAGPAETNKPTSTDTAQNQPAEAGERGRLEHRSLASAVPAGAARASAGGESAGDVSQAPGEKKPRRKTVHRRLLPRKRRRASNDPILAMPWEQYRDLSQWAAEQARVKQVRPPPVELAQRLRRRGIEPDFWYCAVDQFEGWFRRAAGAADKLAKIVTRTGGRWLIDKGIQTNPWCDFDEPTTVEVRMYDVFARACEQPLDRLDTMRWAPDSCLEEGHQ